MTAPEPSKDGLPGRCFECSARLFYSAARMRWLEPNGDLHFPCKFSQTESPTSVPRPMTPGSL